MLFQVWNELTSGNGQFLAMVTYGSQVGNRKFQGLETEIPCHLKYSLSGVYAGVNDISSYFIFLILRALTGQWIMFQPF